MEVALTKHFPVFLSFFFLFFLIAFPSGGYHGAIWGAEDDIGEWVSGAWALKIKR